MYYVEFLRVFRALRIYAIVLPALFIITGAIRVGIGPTIHEHFMRQFSPSATRTVQNENGVETVTINDPAKGVRAIQHQGRDGWDLTIYEMPSGTGKPSHETQPSPAPGDSAGLISESHWVTHDGVHVTALKSDRRLKFDVLAVIAGFVAAIFATVIGASLSRENDGHLELTWTKPSSRERTALIMFGIDVAGILVSFILCAVLVQACIALFVGWPRLIFGTGSAAEAAIALLFPIAWYLVAQALTASMRRGGLVCGLMWVAGLMIPGLLAIHNGLLRIILRTIDTLNPMAYFGNFDMPGVPSPTLFPASDAVNVSALCAIIIIAVIASLLQWRRLEA